MVEDAVVAAAKRGSVVAPAGCGKTELIARVVKASGDGGALILTHTHAGVHALRARLRRLGVRPEQARVDTIAGWCLRLAAAYPQTSGLTIEQPEKAQWNLVYEGAERLLSVAALRAVVRATYSRVLVDEYQDCTARQHRVITAMAREVPTVVLGDPLQGIFRFAGDTAAWKADVEPIFPAIGTLDVPWRWVGKNEELGRWLLAIRPALTAGDEIDLSAVSCIEWKPLTEKDRIAGALSKLASAGTIVAIRKWPKDAHSLARSLAGRYQSMEEIECVALLNFARDMDKYSGAARAVRVIEFASECFSQVGPALEPLRKVLESGSVVSAGRYKHEEVVRALLQVAASTDHGAVVRALQVVAEIEEARVFRRELWREATRLFEDAERAAPDSLRAAAWALRNRNRHMGRAVETRTVSRTLLVKGLEFDHAIVGDADEFETTGSPGDGARNFYVAATRGSRSLTIFSRNSKVRFSPAPL